MRERELRAALENYAARRLPVTPDLWPAIRARAVAYRQLRQDGGAWPAQQGGVGGGPGRRTRVAATVNIVATLALLTVVAVILASVLGGMGGRRGYSGDNAVASATPTAAAVVPGLPYPVPADCPVSPLSGLEERDGYLAYWLDSNGLAIGIQGGLLFEGLNDARSTDLRTVEARLKGDPTAPLRWYGGRGAMGFAVLEFLAPGCWTIEGRGWQDREIRFAVTIYVYPKECHEQTIACRAPEGTVHLAPTATVEPPSSGPAEELPRTP